MNLHVPEKWEPFVRSKMQSGEYASQDAFVDKALTMLQWHETELDEDEIDPLGIEDLLLEGLNSGPPILMTRIEWDKIWAEGERRAAEIRARKAEQRNE